jgi:hypothetical protein
MVEQGHSGSIQRVNTQRYLLRTTEDYIRKEGTWRITITTLPMILT